MQFHATQPDIDGEYIVLGGEPIRFVDKMLFCFDENKISINNVYACPCMSANCASRVILGTICRAFAAIVFVYSHAINGVLIKEKLPGKQFFVKVRLVADYWIG